MAAGDARRDLEREIKEVMSGLLSGRSYCDVVFESCSGKEAENFTNAKMEFKPRFYKSKARLRDMYHPGFQKILDYFKEPTKGGVEILLEFLKVSDTDAQAVSKVFNKKKCTEADVVAVLAVHLFGKLTKAAVTVSANFTNLKKLSHACPCGCGAKFQTGNTGFGSQKVWHGFPDILVNGVSVTVSKDLHQDDGAGDSEGGEDDDEDESRSSSEDETSAPKAKRLHTIEGTQTVAKQVLAQTITNSFIQLGVNNKFNQTFVPSILCSPEGVLIFAYNVKNDLLLHTEVAVPILQTDVVGNPRFSLPTILEIWLALHVSTTGCNADIFLDTEVDNQKSSICFSKSGFKEMMPRETLQEYKTAGSKLSSFPTKEEVNIFEDAPYSFILIPHSLCNTLEHAQSGETQEQVEEHLEERVEEQLAK